MSRNWTEFTSEKELHMVQMGLCLLQGESAVMAEPWVVEAAKLFFAKREISPFNFSINQELLSPLLTSQSKGALMDKKIIAHVMDNWSGKKLSDLPLFKWALGKMKEQQQLQPSWWNDSLSLATIDAIIDNSECTSEDDHFPDFICGGGGSGHNKALSAILPSTLAGPDVVVRTSDRGVFIVFASALSLRGGSVSLAKKRQNEKTTNLSYAYTRKTGAVPRWPKAKQLRALSLRARHERVKAVAAQFKGLIRVHLELPEVCAGGGGGGGPSPSVHIVDQQARRKDVLLHIDASLLPQLFNEEDVQLLHYLCGS